MEGSNASSIAFVMRHGEDAAELFGSDGWMRVVVVVVVFSPRPWHIGHGLFFPRTLSVTSLVPDQDHYRKSSIHPRELSSSITISNDQYIDPST
jgi:hypothetical protein